MKKCREDALYQQRYETEYEEIRQINADFIAVSELIDKYYRHIERGYI